MRTPILLGLLLVLILPTMTCSTFVFAQRRMLIQASFNPTQTDLGLLVALSGRVFEPSNVSVSNAVISIQVNNPQGTSILVAILYTDPSGVFRDRFLLTSNSPAGNYTTFMVVDKPGYETASLVLNFMYSTPDFSMETSISTLSLQQGENGSLAVTILSIRNFNQNVNLTAIDLPTGVTLQFTPPSIVPSGTATVNVIVANSAQIGNFTVTLLAVSGSLSHGTSFRLDVSPGAPQSNFVLLITTGFAIAALVALWLIFRSRLRRKQKEKVLEDLLKQASADSGYVATARVIARLEELRAMGKVDESTYQRLRKEYEKRLEKSK